MHGLFGDFYKYDKYKDRGEIKYSIGVYNFNEANVCVNPTYIFEYQFNKGRLYIYYCFDGTYYDFGYDYMFHTHGCFGGASNFSLRKYKPKDFEIWASDYDKTLKRELEVLKATIEQDKKEHKIIWQQDYFQPFFEEFFRPKQLELF